MGTQKVQMKGWFVGIVIRVQEMVVFDALAALLFQYKIFFLLLYTISINFSPSPSKLGRQMCWVTCLLVCVYGPDNSRLEVERGGG